MPGQEAPTDDGGLGYALTRTAQTWRNEVARALRPHELTPAQFFVLVAVHRAALRGKPPPNQRDIGQRLGMDANTASQVIRTLEQRELLARITHPHDGRARALRLTTAGRDLTTSASRVVRKVNSNFFGALHPDRAVELRSVLDGLTAAAEQR